MAFAGFEFRLLHPTRWFAAVVSIGICACAPNVYQPEHEGRAYFEKGQYDLAIEKYTEQLRLDPKDSRTYYNRGVAYVAKEQDDRALQDFNEAIRLEPKYVKAYTNRGALYLDRKDYDRVIEDSNEAIRLDPNYALPYVNLGNVYWRKGEYSRAIKDYRQALRLDPIDPEPYYSLAWLLATCPNSAFRDGAAALDYARKGCELLGCPIGILSLFSAKSIEEVMMLDALAAASAETGSFGDAVGWEKKALDYQDLSQQDAQQLSGRLKLYQENLPYRQKHPGRPGFTSYQEKYFYR